MKKVEETADTVEKTEAPAAAPVKGKKTNVPVPRLDLISVSQIVESTTNPRFDYGDIKGLAQSISENGLKVALRVRDSGKKTEGKEPLPIYEVTAGHRRIRAIKSLGAKFSKTLVKVEIEPEGYPDEQRLADHIATNDGLNLNMLEQADVFQQLRATGKTDSEIAKKVGKSQMHVHDALLLWDKASDELKTKIKKGKIAPSAVVETLKLAAKKAAEAEAAGEQGDTTGEADKIVSKAETIAGDKKISGKHISEAEGKAKGSRINNTSGKATRVIKDEDKEAKTGDPNASTGPDATRAKLNSLIEALEEEAKDGEKIEGTFEILEGILGWLDKKVKVLDLAKLFVNSTPKD